WPADRKPGANGRCVGAGPGHGRGLRLPPVTCWCCLTLILLLEGRCDREPGRDVLDQRLLDQRLLDQRVRARAIASISSRPPGMPTLSSLSPSVSPLPPGAPPAWPGWLPRCGWLPRWLGVLVASPLAMPPVPCCPSPAPGSPARLPLAGSGVLVT